MPNLTTLIFDRKRPHVGFIGYYVFDTEVPPAGAGPFLTQQMTVIVDRRRHRLGHIAPNLLTTTLVVIVNVTSARPRHQLLLGVS